jgi:hypothetical protein
VRQPIAGLRRVPVGDLGQLAHWRTGQLARDVSIDAQRRRRRPDAAVDHPDRTQGDGSNECRGQGRGRPGGEVRRRAGRGAPEARAGDSRKRHARERDDDVCASASDGYQVLFSLAELAPAFTSSDIIVADTVDGTPLFAYQGPFRIGSPKAARPARSIRMLQRLDVVRLKK